MSRKDDAASQIPVSVITGFLGSGKTTLLARLLGDPRMAKAALIINEFGEVGLDHLLVARPREDVVLLSSGCLCCTLRGELAETLASLYLDRRSGRIPEFDRVLVETTGLADPVPVLVTVAADPDLSMVYTAEKVVATVSAVQQIAEMPEAIKQACVADVLLVTKTDLADQACTEALEEDLQRLNPTAELRRAVKGDVDPAWLFHRSPDAAPGAAGEIRRRLSAFLLSTAPAKQLQATGHGHGHHVDALSFVVTLEGEVSPTGLHIWMSLLGTFRGADLLRIKGLVNIGGRPFVLQAVQSIFHPLEELAEWPDEDRRSQLVFITRSITRQEIERTLDGIDLNMPPPDPRPLIDAEAFRRFSDAMSAFH